MRVEELALEELLDVAYVELVDSTRGLTNPEEVRAALDKAFREMWLDRETWGMETSTLDAMPASAGATRHDVVGGDR